MMQLLPAGFEVLLEPTPGADAYVLLRQSTVTPAIGSQWRAWAVSARHDAGAAQWRPSVSALWARPTAVPGELEAGS